MCAPVCACACVCLYDSEEKGVILLAKENEQNFVFVFFNHQNST